MCNSSILVPVKVGLLDLLLRSVGSQFVIPVYQRNYTWTANHEVKQLLSDIDAVVRKERERHFIGIIIYLEKNIDYANRERSLIDGQQRLTTLFLILYAVKYILTEQKKTEEATLIEKQYLINEYSKTNKLKLKPLISDDEVYQQIVEGKFADINKDSNVYKNFAYIKSHIKEILATHSVNDHLHAVSVNDYLQAVNKLYLVCVPVGMGDYPQKIFESINATGVKLTASDLIRNFLLMPIDSERQDDYYKKYWKPIESIFDNDSKKMQDFFRYFLMARKGNMIARGNVYSEFTQWYGDSVNEYLEDGIFELLLQYAKYHNIIYNVPIAELEENLRGPIDEFRFTSSDMVAPLLMELYALKSTNDLFGNPIISTEQFAEIITILNSYLMRRALCNLATSDITKYFPSLLKSIKLECKDDFSNVVNVFKKYLIERNKGTGRYMPDEKTLRERIKNENNMYTLRSPLFCFFKKMEMENNSAPVDFSNLSIEHLMPQTPTQDWMRALNVTKEEYEDNLHRLGNLTLASKWDNSKMSNNVWEYKNAVLASTEHIRMNRQLIEKKSWGIGDIEERTEYLISEINRIYPYYGSNNKYDDNCISISLNVQGICANAYFYPDNGQVTILEGSFLNDSYENPDAYPDVEDLRNQLKEEEIIKYSGENLIFSQDYTMNPKRQTGTALSPAANLILHGSRNGKDCWKKLDGSPIGDSLNNDEIDANNE